MGPAIGVEQGSSGQPIAERPVAQGKAEAVQVYRNGNAATSALTIGDRYPVIELAPGLTDLRSGCADVGAAH